MERAMLEEGGCILEYIRNHLHKTLEPSKMKEYYGSDYANHPKDFRFETSELYTVQEPLELIKQNEHFFDNLKKN